MWANYGYIFSEYIFIKNFRNDKNLIIENQNYLEKIIKILNLLFLSQAILVILN